LPPADAHRNLKAVTGGKVTDPRFVLPGGVGMAAIKREELDRLEREAPVAG